jgi:hypothetical protein
VAAQVLMGWAPGGYTSIDSNDYRLSYSECLISLSEIMEIIEVLSEGPHFQKQE